MRNLTRDLRAFTLIEVMIAVAILAIVAGVPLAARHGLQGMTRESDYRFALRNARAQVELLRKAPFGSLPPQLVRVPADGWIPLAWGNLVPGSVTLPEGPPLEVDEVRGRVRVPATLAGQTVTVDYRFWLPDRDEAHTVPSRAPFEVPLVNAPALRVDRVWLAEGERLEPIEGSLSADGTRLVLPEEAAGRVVVVDYLGSRVRNRVSGRFLTEDLGPSEGPGPVKLLRVQENYGEGAGSMALTVLRVEP